MSGMWGWFGGQSTQSKRDTPKNAILGLRSQLEMLQKRERHLQTQMDEQDAIARKNISTNKNGTWSRFSCAMFPVVDIRISSPMTTRHTDLLTSSDLQRRGLL